MSWQEHFPPINFLGFGYIFCSRSEFGPRDGIFSRIRCTPCNWNWPKPSGLPNTRPSLSSCSVPKAFLRLPVASRADSSAYYTKSRKLTQAQKGHLAGWGWCRYSSPSHNIPLFAACIRQREPSQVINPYSHRNVRVKKWRIRILLLGRGIDVNEHLRSTAVVQHCYIIPCYIWINVKVSCGLYSSIGVYLFQRCSEISFIFLLHTLGFH